MKGDICQHLNYDPQAELSLRNTPTTKTKTLKNTPLNKMANMCVFINSQSELF